MVRVLLLIAALFVGSPAWAQRAQLSLQAPEVQALQTVGLVVTVIDYQRAVRPPSLVVNPDVEVRFAQEGRPNMQVTNQGLVRTMQYIYAVTPQREGTFTLGPADIVVDGQTVTTNSVQLRVTPRTVTEDTPELEAYAQFENTEVYEGQIVLYRYGLRSRRRIYRDQWVRPPMALLQTPRDGLPVTTEYVIDDPTGPLYVKQNHQALLATAPGDLGQIPATATVNLAVDSSDRRFQRTEAVSIVTDPSPLTVLALPTPPPGFAGLVGDFEFTGSLNRTRVRAGDSVTFTVDVVGDGSLEGFALPEAPLVDGLSFYDNTVGADARIADGAYVAQGRWQRVIVGTKRGIADVPPLQIISFSPSQRRYVTHELAIDPITVRPGDDSEADVESFSEPDSEGEGAPVDSDIRPIYHPWTASTLPTLPWLLAGALLLGLPGVWVVVSSGLGVVQRRRAGRPVAVQSPLARLRAVPVGDPNRLAVLEATLRACMAECSEDALVGEATAALAELGRVRFAGGALRDDLDAQVVALCKRLDAQSKVTS